MESWDTYILITRVKNLPVELQEKILLDVPLAFLWSLYFSPCSPLLILQDDEFWRRRAKYLFGNDISPWGYYGGFNSIYRYIGSFPSWMINNAAFKEYSFYEPLIIERLKYRAENSPTPLPSTHFYPEDRYRLYKVLFSEYLSGEIVITIDLPSSQEAIALKVYQSCFHWFGRGYDLIFSRLWKLKEAFYQELQDPVDFLINEIFYYMFHWNGRPISLWQQRTPLQNT